MESPSAPEKPALEPRWVRPPGMEMMFGIAVFVFVFSVFYTAQIIAFSNEVIKRVPELAAGGFSLDKLQEPAFESHYVEFITNGDAVSVATIWSDVVALIALVAATWFWKRRKTVTFLGLRPPLLRPFLAWIGAFAVFFAAIEGITMLFPELNSEFMQQVLSSSTSFPLLLFGAAILPAVFEEFLIRGLLLGSLRHLLDKHTAIAISAAVFTLMHLQYPWYLLLLVVLPMGVFLGYSRTNSGSIWVPVTLHLINNTLAIVFPQLP